MQLATSRFLWALDPRIVNLVGSEHGAYLAGGALRAALGDEPIIDYDLFFASQYAADGVKMKLKEMYNAETIFVCPEGKLTTFKLQPYGEAHTKPIKVQCITEMYYSDTDHLLGEFDINASRFVFDGFRVETKYSAVRDVLKKQITLHHTNYPNSTMKRFAKYIAKGYTLSNQAVDKFVDRVYTAGAENEFLDPRFYID